MCPTYATAEDFQGKYLKFWQNNDFLFILIYISLHTSLKPACDKEGHMCISSKYF